MLTSACTGESTGRLRCATAQFWCSSGSPWNASPLGLITEGVGVFGSRRDSERHVYPEFCEFTSRSDHLLSAAQLAEDFENHKRSYGK